MSHHERKLIKNSLPLLLSPVFMTRPNSGNWVEEISFVAAA